MVVSTPLIRRNVIIRRFLTMGAVSPETAKAPEEVGSFKGLGVMYERLEARGILKSCEGNRYYIDKAAALRNFRRRRAITIIILCGVIALSYVIATHY